MMYNMVRKWFFTGEPLLTIFYPVMLMLSGVTS